VSVPAIVAFCCALMLGATLVAASLVALIELAQRRRGLRNLHRPYQDDWARSTRLELGWWPDPRARPAPGGTTHPSRDRNPTHQEEHTWT